MLEDSQELIECPRSHDLWESGEGPVVHRATRAELAAHHGICAACAAQLQRRHWDARAGRQEKPADLNEPIRAVDKLHPTAWSDLGDPVPSVGFDFEQIYALDEEAKAAPDEAREIALGLFTRLMLWVWGKPGRKSDREIHAALLRFASFTAGLRPDLLGNATLKEIGQSLGASKQLLSQSSLRCATLFGMRFARNRPDAARDNMSRAMLNSHRRRKRILAREASP